MTIAERKTLGRMLDTWGLGPVLYNLAVLVRVRGNEASEKEAPDIARALHEIADGLVELSEEAKL